MSALFDIIKTKRDKVSDSEEMKELYRYIFTVYPGTVPIEVCAMIMDLAPIRLRKMIETGLFPGVAMPSEAGNQSRYIIYTGKWLEALGVSEYVLGGVHN